MNASNEKSMICIRCPRGCRIEAICGDADWEITGNECSRGESYALQELTDPKRVLTALMMPEGAKKPVSVKTDSPVPKARLMECAKKIYDVHPKLPIAPGDVLIENLCGTGAKVVATRAAK